MVENNVLKLGRLLLRMAARRRSEAFIAKEGLVHANDAALRFKGVLNPNQEKEPETMSEFFKLVADELDDDGKRGTG